MSDALDRAVDAQLDAYRPAGTPPFAVIEARKRSRDRRRYAAAGAALSVVAVAGVALAAGTPGGAPDTARSVAGGPATTGPEAAPGPDAEQAARLCSAAAETFNGQVVGAYPMTVQAVRDYMTGPAAATGYTLPAPGPNEANPVPPSWTFKDPDTTAAACYLDGAFPTPGPPGSGPAERALVMATGGATPFLASSGPKSALPLGPLAVEAAGLSAVVPPPAEVTGLGICRVSPEGPCASLSEADADAIAAALRETAEPLAPDSAVCFAMGVRYRLGFLAGMEQYPFLHLETLCMPLEAGGQRYSIGQELRDEVDQDYRAAAGVLLADEPQQPSPGLPTTGPGRTDFETCLGVPSDPAACTENLPEPGEG